MELKPFEMQHILGDARDESSSSNANKCPEHTKDRKVWYLGFLKTSPVVVVSQAQSYKP